MNNKNKFCYEVQMADIPEDSVNLDKEVGKHSYVEGKTETFCGLKFYIDLNLYILMKVKIFNS